MIEQTTANPFDAIDELLQHLEDAPSDCQCDLCRLSLPHVPHLAIILESVPDGWFGVSHDDIRMHYA